MGYMPTTSKHQVVGPPIFFSLEDVGRLSPHASLALHPPGANGTFVEEPWGVGRWEVGGCFWHFFANFFVNFWVKCCSKKILG